MELRPVPYEEKEQFRKFFQVYQHELSFHSGSHSNLAGQYPYVYFDLYWEPDKHRFPFYVMENNEVAGLLLLRHLVKDELNRPIYGMQISEIYVTSRFRATGLAVEVVTEAARRAQAENRRLTWSCYQTNFRALGLYNKILKLFSTSAGWKTQREVFVDLTGRSRIFFSLIPDSALAPQG